MAPRLQLLILGLGAAGQAAAEYGAALGLRVAVVEPGVATTGDRWAGAGPSKALVATAARVAAFRTAGGVGLEAVEPPVDRAEVWRHVRAVRDQLAASARAGVPDEVEIHRGEARFVDAHVVAVGAQHLEADFVLVCTGSIPDVPEVDGLTETGCLTTDELWDLEGPPAELLLLGGGPAATELAQALARVGVAVTIVERRPRLLPRDEPELVELLTARLRGEGLTVDTDATVEAATRVHGRPVLSGRRAGRPATWSAGEVLLAAGRRPAVAGLGLEEVGVEVTPNGVVVDQRGRTAVPWVYAAGDVTGGPAHAHVAAAGAIRAVRDMYPSSFLPSLDRRPEVVPWCTFTDPPLGHAGLTVAEAEVRHGDDVDVWRRDLAGSVLTAVSGDPIGRVVLVTARTRLVGGHVLGPGAGEVVNELALAIRQQMKLHDVAESVHASPTLGSIVWAVANDAAYERASKLRWVAGRRRRS